MGVLDPSRQDKEALMSTLMSSVSECNSNLFDTKDKDKEKDKYKEDDIALQWELFDSHAASLPPHKTYCIEKKTKTKTKTRTETKAIDKLLKI